MSYDFPRPNPLRRQGGPGRRPRALLPTLLVLVVLAVLYGIFTSFWTDRLWFSAIGYLNVFTTELVTRIVMFIVFGVLMGAILAANILVSYRLRPRYRAMSVEQQSIERYRQAVDPVRRWVVIGVSIVVGLIVGGSAAGQWKTFLLWRNGGEFGVADPEFNLDVGFYTFDYPWWRFLLGFGFAAVILSLVAAAITHYIYGGIRVQTPGERLTGAAQAHLSLLIGLLVLLKAVAYWLDRYGLLLGDHRLFTGASFTDIKAVLPAKTILTFIALICALLFFANVIRRSWTLPGIGLGLLVLSAVLLGAVWPAVVQQFQVRPNEPERENDYIARNIASTRTAYGVTEKNFKVAEYDATTEVTPGQLREDAETVPGIRLLDPNVVSNTFQQLQQVRGFYSFADPLDVDRYDIDGRSRDIVVAARELDITGIPAGQQNWINEHTVYTHGFGIVAAYGNRRQPDGAPVWAEEDIPSKGVLGDFEPRIYYGENSPAYSIVGAPKDSKPVEFDIPEDPESGGQQRQNTYDGKGGVPVGSLFTRLLYATKFQEGNILLTDRINSESKIMYDRHPRTRLEKVAPWLTVDGNPYPAVVDGKIKWIIDAYTTTDFYPYSRRIPLDQVTSDSRTARQSLAAQPSETINYVRNSVKATVDAFDGTVALYAWDPSDPMLKAWMKAFPGTVKPASEISDDLRAHLRYPEDLFKIQRELLARYHVTDPKEFYGGQDFWIIPSDPTAGENVAQPPYYLTLQMPDQEDAAFSLTTTYVPQKRQNLAGFMAVNADARSPDYGTIRLLRLPGSTQIAGPGQVANTFETNQEVAEVTLPLRQSGAATREGNLLTLPVGGGLLYVQPIYVERRAGDARYPLLRLVLVSFGERVGVGSTLQEALDEVFGGQAGAETGEQPLPPATPAPTPTPGATTTPAPGGETPPPASGTLTEALADAQRAFEEAEKAAAEGRWADYGKALDELETALERANQLSGGSEQAAPTPTPTGG